MTNDNYSKPKILYVITQGEWGGAQRYVFDIATKIVDDFDVYVAIGEKDGKNDLQNKLQITIRQLADKLQINDKIQIIKLQHLKRKISPISDVLAIFELRKLYKTLKPNIIHLNSSKAGIIGSVASLFLIPYSLFLVYTVHGWVFNEPTRKLGRILYRFLEKITAKIKNKIIVLSDRDLNDGIKLGIDEKKLVKIPLGIETPQFLDKEEARQLLASVCHSECSEAEPRNPLNNVQGIPPLSRLESGSVGMTVWVGTVANLYKTKGLDVLIEAAHILNTKYSIQNTKFIIIGEGPERKNLEFRIKNYELEDTIYLTGAIDNAARYLKAFDLFVLPSRKEGLPYTILEAIAAEIPIVATDVGGIQELIGNTIQPDNPEILAEAIMSALNNPKPAKSNALTIEKMLEETKKIVFGLVNKKPRF